MSKLTQGKIKDAMSKGKCLIYTPKGTEYEIVGCGLFKRFVGHWVKAVTYKSSDGRLFTRLLCDLDKFEIPE